MSHYSTDYEHDQKLARERFKKKLKLAHGDFIESEVKIKELEPPQRIIDAMEMINDWLYVAKGGSK